MKRFLSFVVIDVLTALVLACTMASALIEDFPHEWLGIAYSVLCFVHIVQHRKQLFTFPKNSPWLVRAFRIVLVVGMLTCVAFQLVSSTSLSRYVLASFPSLIGSSQARSLHLLCSYWLFVFVFVHAGFSAQPFIDTRIRATPRGSTARLAWVVAIIIVGALGILAAIQLRLWEYLSGSIAFAEPDISTPLPFRVGKFCLAGAYVFIVGCILRVLFEGPGNYLLSSSKSDQPLSSESSNKLQSSSERS